MKKAGGVFYFFIAITVILIFVSSLTVALVLLQFTRPQSYMPVTAVTGDVDAPYNLSEKYAKLEKVRLDGKRSGVPLSEVLQQAAPVSGDGNLSSVLLVSEDGPSMEISVLAIEKSYIVFTAENGYEAVNYDHPDSGNITHLKDIVYISGKLQPDYTYGISVITPTENLLCITYGQLYKSALTVSFEPEETPENTTASVYRQQKSISVSNLANCQYSKAMVISQNGAVFYDAGDGNIILRGNRADYYSPSQKETISDIAGIILDYPAKSITDIYEYCKQSLAAGCRTAVIYLDGVSYETVQEVTADGFMPYIGENGDISMAVSVYPPITNSGMAAMITGQTPDITGIHSHADNKITLPTIFELTENALLIEGSGAVLSTKLIPVLTLSDDSGDTDSAVFEELMKTVNGENNAQLIMAHFHGSDDYSHAYGPRSPLFFEKLRLLDTYVKSFCQRFDGSVILIADHGQHENGGYGSHGQIRYEDMIVPFIIMK